MNPCEESDGPDVVLLRACEESDRYVRAFEGVGLSATCEPVLSFTFPNHGVLASHLKQRDRYGALVATSPRVGTALDRIFDERPDLRTLWEGAPAYAVGPKTAASLRDVGLDSIGEDAGNAEALAEKIARNAGEDPLLFLCGNRRRDELPDRLWAVHVPFDELVVYETHTRDELTLPATEHGIWLVFFSPSGLEAVEKSTTVDDRLAGYGIAAIGPTTAGALEDAGIAVEAVASEPSPKGLVEAVAAATDP